MSGFALSSYLKAVSNPEQPLASLIVPVYNMREWLESFLKSCAQFRTLLPYELIFVDNNSTDGSLEYLQSVGARVVIEKRQGVNYARQCGVELAKSKVIISMDADTAYPPNFIDEMALPLYEYPAVSVVWATSVGCTNPYKPTAIDRIKLLLKSLLHARLQGNLDQAKQVRAHAMSFRKETGVFYPSDVQNVAGCDDGLVAVQLLQYGRPYRNALRLFTKIGSEERIVAYSQWPKI